MPVIFVVEILWTQTASKEVLPIGIQEDWPGVPVGDSDAERAQKWMDEISEKYSNTVYGTAARASKAKPEDSEVGKVAPTFVGETIDGFQFSLEDYRGKVVALDFYGFW